MARCNASDLKRNTQSVPAAKLHQQFRNSQRDPPICIRMYICAFPRSLSLWIPAVIKAISGMSASELSLECNLCTLQQTSRGSEKESWLLDPQWGPAGRKGRLSFPNLQTRMCWKKPLNACRKPHKKQPALTAITYCYVTFGGLRANELFETQPR